MPPFLFHLLKLLAPGFIILAIVAAVTLGFYYLLGEHEDDWF